MQGASSVDKRLRFEWIPVLTWKVRPTEELQAICHRWSKSVYLTSVTGTIIHDWVFDFYYDQPARQQKGISFDNWLRDIYQSDLPYLHNSLWEWVEQHFKDHLKVDEPGDSFTS